MSNEELTIPADLLTRRLADSLKSEPREHAPGAPSISQPHREMGGKPQPSASLQLREHARSAANPPTRASSAASPRHIPMQRLHLIPGLLQPLAHLLGHHHAAVL